MEGAAMISFIESRRCGKKTGRLLLDFQLHDCSSSSISFVKHSASALQSLIVLLNMYYISLIFSTTRTI